MTDKQHDAAPEGNKRVSDVDACLARYWISNTRIMATLTIAWLLIGLGCGVLFADRLNEFNLPGTGYPLGFCLFMNRLDAKHHDELSELRKTQQRD